MPTGRYLVSINGFKCNRQTWDDALNWDGKADEVFIAVGYKRANKSGIITALPDPGWERVGQGRNHYRRRFSDASPLDKVRAIGRY